MLHKRIFPFVIVCVMCLPAFSLNEHNVGTDSGQDFSVYFLRTDHPLSKFDITSFPSVEDLILARNHENKLLGSFDSSYWRKGVLTESEYETSSEDKCTYNNGNCSQICETVENEAICSCDEGLSLVDGTDCHSDTSGSAYLSGTSGKFMMNEKDKTWIIKAPKNHIIELEISRSNGLSHYYAVYDSHTTEQRRLSPYYSSTYVHKFRSPGPYLYIKTYTEWIQYDTFAVYKTEPTLLFFASLSPSVLYCHPSSVIRYPVTYCCPSPTYRQHPCSIRRQQRSESSAVTFQEEL